MSIHKLTAGSGYDYLTRQVAALDATDKGHTGLASYYTEKGETPGMWVGSGMTGIDGLDAGDVVTADHMQALFGAGHHPLANERVKELDLRIGRPGVDRPTDADYKNAVRLGAPYKVYDNDVSAFRIEVAKRIAAVNQTDGLPGDWPVPAAVRAKIRTEVAAEFFRAEHGRDPADARELAATIAKHSRPKTTAVAGYDLTFSPVKSFSVLWALADPAVAAKLETAHNLAVKDALEFIERRALFTREGSGGVRQVDVRGLLGAAFTHRDSRAGDPDLHTHVAVANKVQTLDGKKWLAIDGRLMFKAVVAASEVYNTRLEAHARDQLGLRFAERPNPDARKRPIREILGVDPQINTRFSKRRISVEDRRQVLATEFQRTHGRPPTPIETIQLAQQATLETREAKHEPRSLAEQRRAWNAEAIGVFGGGSRGRRRLTAMIRQALHPEPAAKKAADSAWFAETAETITAAMEGRRAMWQIWHVHAEAQRQVRAALAPGDIATEQIDPVVDLLVGEVLDGRSISLARRAPAGDDELVEPVEPPELRRADGSSVYTVAGADLYTSARVLAAEQRLVDAAGRRDGYAVDETCVDLALLESAANGVTLNAGQAALVRQMATSGARVQLAIAPAGSGKTTAMRALAQAWSEGGGTVIGLAPSAAAADALRSQIGTGTASQTDTLAKLVYTLTDPFGKARPPAWFKTIGPESLVVIDEAGMADTLSLDIAVSHILDRGGSVRLVGDDQQLGAIGAGGVLRDIRATHGALHLSELVRFADSAEGAASLALREGKTEALGFYLDHDRVHVGDLSTMTEDVFSSWQADRAGGLDSIMLAPTRDLVSQLNQQARAHRLQGADPRQIGQVRRLADGNEASVGELIITRENDRKLRVSATDWVKNGDRWTILAVHAGGDLTVQHTRHGRKVQLPADYVAQSVELGYACTINGAQGVTADTMHGLATGTESRQQLYTMLTRAAYANHLYLQAVGDGDPHSVIHPNLVHPLTPTDMIEAILARDEAPRSALSLLSEQSDPGLRLGDATARYTDSLYVAAEHLLRAAGPRTADGLDPVDVLDMSVDTVVPGLSEEPAWPTLRAHLLLLGAHGLDPIEQLQIAVAERELDTAGDRAAVLDWRLDDTGMRSAGTGPLPWLPGIPEQLAQDTHWGQYLTQRAALVSGLADQVRNRSLEQSSLPGWAQNGIRPGESTIANVEVWRAAAGVSAEDRRPTGPAQLQKAAATWQRRLNRRLASDRTPALAEWGRLLHSVAPQIAADDFTPLLSERLAAMSRTGIAAGHLLRSAAAAGPLPDEHAAAALWWRMARHLTPAVAAEVSDPNASTNLTTGWTEQLTDLLGDQRAERVQASNWWPALVTNIDHGLAAGWRLEDLIAGNPLNDGDHTEGIDECQALVWRTSIALVPIPDDQSDDYWFDPPPDDLWDNNLPPADEPTIGPDWVDEPIADDWHSDPEGIAVDEELDEDQYIEGDLTVAALVRSTSRGVPLEPTEADIRKMYQRAEDWEFSPVTRIRMLEINDLTQAFFTHRFNNSWGRDYLTGRFGVDLAGHEHFGPGQAPAGWTNLVDHLRRQGVTDTEMLTVGVATMASTGRLIDRFRDRVMFPITRTGSNGVEILGFVGRRRPELTEADKAGPKYLNTAQNPLFHKGDQLYGLIDELVADGAVPVIVEGPMDAIAVTLASAGRYVGVAPLGTSLTDEQAAQLAVIGRDPIVATDSDLAGQVAAERDFWMLTPHGLDPGYARFPASMDPADLLALRGPAALVGALSSATPLGDRLLSERLDNLPPEDARIASTTVVAARPGHAWDAGSDRIQTRLGLSQLRARRELRNTVRTWNADPRRAAANELASSSKIRARLASAMDQSPSDRWAGLATELDPRLLTEVDWPATATILQEAHDQGHDITTTAHELLTEQPLGDQPARDLRYRLVSRLNITIDTPDLPTEVPTSTPTTGTARDRQKQRSSQPGADRGPRR
ncbi:DNA primase, catalytic core [Brevibacterium sp. Mu109]|uniref:MobF family relaxase n=1 Tax=Brevibacterium sp. Mu109 TaxID=1255669 RepID=UPI000C3897E2|nr:MobF family relaxase [Brevibacterium sp. Mu109]SMX87187.1 DNA primase, catalytic core [Brevibacterium sp. Mu109]